MLFTLSSMDLDDILGGAWIKNFIECTQMLGNTIAYRCPLQNANVRSALLFLRQSFVILVITWQVGRQYLHLLVVFCSTGTCISNAQLQQFLGEFTHIRWTAREGEEAIIPLFIAANDFSSVSQWVLVALCCCGRKRLFHWDHCSL